MPDHIILGFHNVNLSIIVFNVSCVAVAVRAMMILTC